MTEIEVKTSREDEVVCKTFENSFTPSRAKFRRPKTEAFAGDIRC